MGRGILRDLQDENRRLRHENQRLTDRVGELEDENRRLCDQLVYLSGHPTIAKGLKGERFIANLLSGKLSGPGAGYDFEGSDGRRYEIKAASLRPIKGVITRRWTWSKLFGGKKCNKQYDRLLLLGESDPHFAAAYKDPTAPYVCFDLSYEDVKRIVGELKPDASIWMTTNPRTVKAPRLREMFDQLQVTSTELQRRYAHDQRMSEFCRALASRGAPPNT